MNGTDSAKRRQMMSRRAPNRFDEVAPRESPNRARSQSTQVTTYAAGVNGIPAFSAQVKDEKMAVSDLNCTAKEHTK